MHLFSPGPSVHTYLSNFLIAITLHLGFWNPPWLRTTLDFAVPHECWFIYNISNIGALVSFMTLPYHHISSTSVMYHCICVWQCLLGIAYTKSWIFPSFLLPNGHAKPAVEPKLIPKVIIGTQLNLTFWSFLNEIQLVYLLHLVDDVTIIIAHPNMNQLHCSIPSILTCI